MIDMRMTIVPKSDQLNADDLIGTTKTIRIIKVSRCTDGDQPIAIHFEGDDGKPFKPGKSMRRVMVYTWGADGSNYEGRSMTLYRDEKVKFGGLLVGGIRISHMSDIKAPITMALTETRGMKKGFTVQPLKVEATKAEPPADERLWIDRVLSAIDIDNSTKQWRARVWKACAEVATIGDLVRIERHDRVVDAIAHGDPQFRSDLDALFRETAIRLAPKPEDDEPETETATETA
jgi:hypothetical protein